MQNKHKSSGNPRANKHNRGEHTNKQTNKQTNKTIQNNIVHQVTTEHCRTGNAITYHDGTK